MSAKKNNTPEELVNVGRPSKLTEEMILQIEEELPHCMYIETVCEMAGIDRSTLLKWLTRGRRAVKHMVDMETDSCAKSDVLYVQFFRAHKKGMARGEIDDCKLIKLAAVQGAWQAAAWRLERRFPEKYGTQNREIRLLEKKLVELQSIIEQFKSKDARIAELEADLAKARRRASS